MKSISIMDINAPVRIQLWQTTASIRKNITVSGGMPSIAMIAISGYNRHVDARKAKNPSVISDAGIALKMPQGSYRDDHFLHGWYPL